ncbi:MAG: orotate phosphoribosyltransferase [bacterium]|jgi:orotate phosphoribosyltransferase
MNEVLRLQNLLLQRSVKTGSFTLSGGATSSYYVDARRTTMMAEGQVLVGKVCYDRIMELEWGATHVGGLTLGADPIAYAIARHSFGGTGPTLDGLTVRKEAKGHGTGRQVEGGAPAGAKVVVLEDIVTTGKSAFLAIEALEKAEMLVAGVLCLVDREEGGREKLEKYGLPFEAIFTKTQLLQEKLG